MWEIRSNAHFRQSPPNGDTTGPLKTAFYVQVDPTGHAGGGYRFPLWGEHIISDIWGQMLPERKQTELYIITGKKILTFITNKLSNKLTSVFRIHISFNKNPDPTLYLNANRDPGNHINKDLDLLTFKFHFLCD
jgi:hypothetical protein